MMSIKCPWCGTNYEEFQQNCVNCGGSLPLPQEKNKNQKMVGEKDLIVPPEPPRNVPDSHIWRLLSTKPGPVLAGISGLLGLIFGIIGLVLTISIIVAFVGVPFLILGILFFAIAIPIFLNAYQNAKEILAVLRYGESIKGRILSVQENFMIRISHRHPWRIGYEFDLGERTVSGTHTTLAKPGIDRRSNQPVYILYDPENPDLNSIYPNPFGYYGF